MTVITDCSHSDEAKWPPTVLLEWTGMQTKARSKYIKLEQKVHVVLSSGILFQEIGFPNLIFCPSRAARMI
jgi:hypothetical protein